ncbi:MAG: hypothetical protein E7069_13195 [Bacteroidales bacterium]|jgi:hypothetical protein|nr:hypothetical protein [Bacteroidales bacterium]
MNKSSDIAFSAAYDAWGKRAVKRNTLGPLAHRNMMLFGYNSKTSALRKQNAKMKAQQNDIANEQGKSLAFIFT